MPKEKCWACSSPIIGGQVICLNCKSWQNWRRYLSVSNSTIALLVALLSLIALLGTNFQGFIRSYFPEREVHISGYYSPAEKQLTIQAHNFGDVPANLASNIRCFFGMENAMFTALGKRADAGSGIEVEFWSLRDRIVGQKQTKKIEFTAQVLKFEETQKQALCFSALNYLSNDSETEDFLLVIVPHPQHSWWPVEGFFSEKLDVWALYEQVSSSN